LRLVHNYDPLRLLLYCLSKTILLERYSKLDR